MQQEVKQINTINPRNQKPIEFGSSYKYQNLNKKVKENAEINTSYSE